MANPFENDEDPLTPAERLAQAAEELMRQGRYQDAANRYQDLRRMSPTDIWTTLGYASALECAGRLQEAERLIEEASDFHQGNRHLQRFRRMFFERREDPGRFGHSLVLSGTTGWEHGAVDQLADLYFNQGRYLEALNELQRLLREEALDDHDLRASILGRLGACYRQRGDAEAAHEALLQSLALNPDNAWILAELAEVERARGNVEAARRRYKEALLANPTDDWCRGHLAQLEHEQGNSAKAIQLYEEILGRDHKIIWAKVELAGILANDQPDRAEALCQEVLQEDPTYPWAWAQLGVLARNREQLPEARHRFQQALAAAPNATWIIHELADTCRRMDRLEEAYTHLEHAKAINPFDSTTYGYMADFLRSEGRGQEALANLQKAVELDRNYLWAWREMAELHSLAGRHDEAQAAWRTTNDIAPDDALNDGLQAFLLRNRGRRDEAVTCLERAVARQPDYLWAWRELVETHLFGGRPLRAAETAAKGLAALPAHPHLLALRAEALRQLGQRREAMELIEEALDQDDNVAQVWALRSELLAEQDPDGALADARIAMDMEPDQGFQLLVARLLAARGDTDEALALMTTFIKEMERVPAMAFDLLAELTPDPDEARQVVERGLVAHPDDIRLRLRRARLALATGDRSVLTSLEDLFQRHDCPWRELARLFVQGGDALNARRAVHRLLDLAEDQVRLRGVAWQEVAEIELELGNFHGALAAGRRALGQEPVLPQTRALVAMLAQQLGDTTTAIRLMTELEVWGREQRLPPSDRASLTRQMARCLESTDPQAAWARWQDTLAHDPRAEIYEEAARFLTRQQRAAEADRLLEQGLATFSSGSERQRLLHHLALLRADQEGPAAGLNLLTPTDSDPLSLTNQLLRAKLCLHAGRAVEAQDLLDGLGTRTDLTPPDRITMTMLRARCALARNRVKEAIAILKALRDEYPQDQAVAVLLAQILIIENGPQAALDLLTDPRLGPDLSTDRVFLLTVLHLDRGDLAAAFSCLARHDHLRQQNLAWLRVLAAAWPAFGPASGTLTLSDLTILPPLPGMISRVAAALSERGQLEPAAVLLISLATNQEACGQRHSSGRLKAQAAPLLRRLGRRRQALRLAWEGRCLPAFLRCLLPW